METLENLRNNLFNSVGLKLTLIVFLSLILMIPATMITGLIRERQNRHDETITNVSNVWGNAQTLSGPVLTLAFKSTEGTGQNESRILTRYAHFLPEKLEVTGSVDPEVRYRGIYKVVTYRAKIHVTGSFRPPDLVGMQIRPEETEGQPAWVEIGLSDLRGINRNSALQWGDSALTLNPGIPSQQVSAVGVHAPVQVDPGRPVQFAFDLDLNGSNSLSFLPFGNETKVNLSSPWESPSFIGAFLPDDRKVNQPGFTAAWEILQLNRNYPQQWIDNLYPVDGSAFGVELKTPVDMYQKSMRSVKYAILFIGLTFLVFFFAEVMTRMRIHPINYLLAGTALVIFYSLLTALSEYLRFSLAYLVAAITIISMIGAFSHSLYCNKKVTLVIVLILTTLYAFLFVILQLADYSLLVGNAGLVIILGLVMYFSRRIDWYSPLRGRNQEG